MELSSRPPAVSPDEADMLARMAEDYYIRGRSQAEIAKQLNISRSYVSRLLNRASKLGIVKISINHPLRTHPELGSELRTRFHLKDCLVVGGDGTDGMDDQLRLAGAAAARYLMDTVQPEHTLALSWGTGIKAIGDALKTGQHRAVRVVQMFGGLSLPRHDISGADLVGRIARKLDASFDYLHAPWIVESAVLAKALKGQPDVARTLGKAAGAEMAFVGVGATGQGSSGLLFNETYLSRQELNELRTCGAVGDIAARCFDEDGKPCRLSFDDRIIGLGLPALRRIPTVVAIATGAHKATALRAALRGGLIDVLVTDRAAALGILRE